MSLPEWFETDLITRGTEIDFTATVGMPVVLRYFELLRWQLMVEPVFGLRAHIDAGHFFVVRSQTIELRQRVGQRVAIKMRTRIDHAGRATATVAHEAIAEDGSLVARARVLGVWLGPDRKIARLPDHFRALVTPRTRELEHDDGPVRIAHVRGGIAKSFIDAPRVTFTPLSIDVDPPSITRPESVLFQHHIVVPPRDLDVFSHVNAATWLAYADDTRELAACAAERDPALRAVLNPDVLRGHVARVAIFYAREAALHDALTIALGRISDGGPHAWGVWFFRGDEAVCTMRLDLASGARAVTVPGA